MKNTEAEAACSDAREGVSRCKHSNYGGCVQRINYQHVVVFFSVAVFIHVLLP